MGRQHKWISGNNMTDAQKAWVVGIIDGEGCIHISKGKEKYGRGFSHKLTISVKSADKLMVPKLRELTGVGSVHFYDRNSKNRNHVNCLCWNVCSKDSRDLLEAILPYLVVKYEQAYLAIVFQNELNKRSTKRISEEGFKFRDTCYLLMKDLKEWLKNGKNSEVYFFG